MTMMAVIEERESDAAIFRVLMCDCLPDDDWCGQVFMVGSLVGFRSDVWGCLLTGPMGRVMGLLDAAVENEPIGENDRTPVQTVEKVAALIGLTWDQMASSHEMPKTQMAVSAKLPVWMWNLPCELLWTTRGVVFGSNLTRVPRALFAMGYMPDAPAKDAEVFEGARRA